MKIRIAAIVLMLLTGVAPAGADSRLVAPTTSAAPPDVLMHKAFITNDTHRSVSVLDTATNQLLAEGLPWPDAPWVGAITPDGTRLFLAGGARNAIYGMSTLDYTMVVTIPMRGQQQRGLVISPNGRRMYVADNPRRQISGIDLSTNQLVHQVTLPNGSHPEQIAISPDGLRVYVPANTPDDVYVMDALTGAVLATLQAGTFPKGVAASPDGQRFYIANWTSATVTAFDAQTYANLGTIPAGLGADYLVISPDGTRLYCSNYNGNSISVIDTGSLTVIATIHLDGQPLNTAITPNGRMLYVPLTTGKVIGVDTATNQKIGEIDIAGTLYSVITRPAAPGE